MPEEVQSTTPAVQGSTVHDAAEALLGRWEEQEKAANQPGAPAAEAEVPAEEIPAQEEPEAEEAPEEAAEPQQPVPTLYTVKVDGEEKQVPVEELVKGYQFGADYTRKTQKLAEERRASEAETAAAKQERAFYAQLLPVLHQVLTQNEQPPDFDKLYQENPIEAVKVEREWRRKQEVIQQARQEQQRLNQIQQQETQKALQKTLEEESSRLMEAIPEWKDKNVAEPERKALIETAKKAGYAEEEVSNVTDHRAVVILRKAMLYDKMQATRQTLRPEAQQLRPAPPTANKTPAITSEITRAKQRLAKTGTVRDAASVIEKML